MAAKDHSKANGRSGRNTCACITNGAFGVRSEYVHVREYSDEEMRGHDGSALLDNGRRAIECSNGARCELEMVIVRVCKVEWAARVASMPWGGDQHIGWTST